MGEVFDLCIVGAGLFGSAAARHASANPGLRVCLIGPNEPTEEERPSREIFSCHYDEGRVTRVLDDNPVCQILSRHAIARYREIEKLSGIQFYHPVGFMCIGQKGKNFMQRMVQNAVEGKIPIVDLSYNDILKQRYPFIKIQDDEYVILEDIGGGHISPRNLVAAQQKVAVMQGCHLIRDIVEKVAPLKDGVHEISTSSGSTLKAKRVLICTGSFTNFKQLVPTNDGRKPDITVKHETVAFLRIPPKEAQRLGSLPSIVYYREEKNSAGKDVGAYVLPPILYPDGHYYLKIGHFDQDDNSLDTLQEVKDWYLSKGDSKIIESLSKFLIQMLGLEGAVVSGFTCATCRSASGLPYIDRVTPTLTLAVVGHGKGAKFSEEVGRIAAALATYGRWESELDQAQFRTVWK